jgi:hypothetical protein
MSAKYFAAVSSVLFIVLATTAVSAQPAEGGPETPADNPGEQSPGGDKAPENISDNAEQGPISQIPGVDNRTLPATISPPEMPELPSQASDVAQTVTSTISDAFSSSGLAGGLGSAISEGLQFLQGSDGSESPVNQTNSTER